MKTSGLLLNESGDRIENWCAYFSATPHPDHPDTAAMASVVHSFLIEGHLEDFHRTPLSDFVQIIEQPFEIAAVECLYLNRDSIYDEGMIEALAHFTHTSKQVPVALVSILPAELAGAGLMLDDKTLSAFRRGHPIWRRGALSCASGRGQRGRSGASDLLRKAIRSWTTISEQTVRHSFKRAKKAGIAFQHRHKDLTKASRELVEYHLGYYRTGRLVDTTISEKHITRVALKTFRFETTRTEAKGDLFPMQKSGRTDLRNKFYRDRVEIITAEIERDVRYFERLNPGLRFDALAIADWNLSILLWLRLAYTLTTSIDYKRSFDRQQFRAAATQEERDDIAQRFSLKAYSSIEAIRSGVSKPVRIAHIDLAGTSETALIAFFADIDPRTIHAQLYPFALADQEALFQIARWLGNFHRQRQGYMTPQQAKLYFYLLERTSPLQGKVCDDEETRGLRFAVRMISSFITPRGLSRLEDAAAAAIADGIGRTIYAINPDYDGTLERQAAARKATRTVKLSRLKSGLAANGVPFPVSVPAGRLLIPGDYAEAWVGRCLGLLGVLDKE